jgi:flagellar basal body-associated protein FliL
MTTTSTILVVVVVGVVIYMLFSKAEKTIAGANRSIKQTYTTGTAAASVVTNLAPALGKFLGNLLDDSDGPYDRSGSANYTDDSFAEASFDEGYT